MCQSNEERFSYKKHVGMCARENLARYGHLILGGSYYTYTGHIETEVESYARRNNIDNDKFFKDVKTKIHNLCATTGIMFRDLPNLKLCDPLQTDDEGEKLKLEKIRKEFSEERVSYMCHAQDCVVGQYDLILGSYEKRKELSEDYAKKHNLSTDRLFDLVYRMASYERRLLGQEIPEQH